MTYFEKVSGLSESDALWSILAEIGGNRLRFDKESRTWSHVDGSSLTLDQIDDLDWVQCPRILTVLRGEGR